MKKLIFRSVLIMTLFVAGMAITATAQGQVKVYQPTVVDTLSGVKFSSLSKEKQAELRKGFEANNLQVADDALIFYAKRKAGETTVLTQENGKLLQSSLPKGGVYMVPNREALQQVRPKGPQKIYITEP